MSISAVNLALQHDAPRRVRLPAQPALASTDGATVAGRCEDAARMKNLRKVLALSWEDRRLLVVAAALLALACALVVLVPFRHYSRWLGNAGAQTSSERVAADIEAWARKVAWAVPVAAHHVPWKAECLPQAIAAKWLLSRRGIPATLYLGAAKDAAELLLHAWLRVGDFVVTGESRARQFAVIASFS